MRKLSSLLSICAVSLLASCVGERVKEPEYTDVEALRHLGKFIATVPGETPAAGTKYGVYQNSNETSPTGRHGKKVIVPFVYDYITKVALSPYNLGPYTDPDFLLAQKGNRYDMYTYGGDTIMTDFDDFEVVNNANFGNNKFFNHILFKKGGKVYAFFARESDNTYFPSSQPYRVFGPYDEVVATGAKAFFFREGNKWGVFKPYYHKKLSRVEKETDQNVFIEPEYDYMFSFGPTDRNYDYYAGQKDGKWYVFDDSGELTTDTYDSFKPADMLKMKIDNTVKLWDLGLYIGNPPNYITRHGNQYVGHAYFDGDDKQYVRTNRDVNTWRIMQGRLGPAGKNLGKTFGTLNY